MTGENAATERRQQSLLSEIFGLARIVLTTALLAILSPAVAQDYDLVILNGRVMDPETGFDEVRNVGVKNGKIESLPLIGL